MFKVVEPYCGICDQTFSKLLDVYQMQDWGMTWEEFLNQFELELQEKIENWKKEDFED